MVVLLVPIVEILVALVALAIAFMARSLAAPFINFFSRQISSFLKPIDWLTNRMVDLAIELTKNIAPAFEEGVKPLVGWVHALGQLSEYTAHAIYRNALQLNQFAHWVTLTYIPRELKAVTGHATSTTLVKVRTQPFTKAQLRRLEDTIASQVFKMTHAVYPSAIPLTWPKLNWDAAKWRKWLGVGAGAGALALPGSIAWERTKWKAQDKTNTQTHKRFRTLNWLLAFTGAAGLVAAGLAKLGLGWMPKCNNLKHIGKSFCGADLAGLIGLFGTLALIEGNFSIVTMAEDMLAVEGPMVKLIGDAFSELDGLV